MNSSKITVHKFQLFCWQINRVKQVYGDSRWKSYVDYMDEVFENILSEFSEHALDDAIEYSDKILTELGQVGNTNRFKHQIQELDFDIVSNFIYNFKDFYRTTTSDIRSWNFDDPTYIIDKIQIVFMFLFPEYRGSYYFWYSDWIENAHILTIEFRESLFNLRTEILKAEVRDQSNMGKYGEDEFQIPVYYN